MTKYIPLRCHSSYSICESSLTIKEMIDYCHVYNVPAIAITDTNNMFGIREFSMKLAKAGIQPIIGMQITVASEHNTNLLGGMVILCTSTVGYKNLLKIHSTLYHNTLKSLNKEPFITLKQLVNFAEDNILLTGGGSGFLAHSLQIGQSEDVLSELKHAFQDKLYIEIDSLYNGDIHNQLLSLALKFNIPICATNNAFFNVANSYEANHLLRCIKHGVSRYDSTMKRLSPESYLKPPKLMEELFIDLPEALENTVSIAKRCLFFVEKRPLSLPSLFDSEQDIIAQSKLGLSQRLIDEVYEFSDLSKEKIDEIYSTRLNYELDIISKMGFNGYFLVVSDFIKWAKNEYIPVGPGRGSGAGSLVAWALAITDVNPIKFGLLFERFLNPERISMPDFDIDFCGERRDEVVDYVRKKYGEDKVANIVTLGTLQAKAAIKDVGRALAIPYSKVDLISKLIPAFAPSNPQTLKNIIDDNQKILNMMDQDPQIQELFEMALQLEGMFRNLSTHAAGIVISDIRLDNIIPLYFDQDSDLPSVACSMKYIEDFGLIKFDFLALATLTIIQNTLKEIKSVHNIDINLLQIPYNDAKVTELLSNGHTLGIFQLEGYGVTQVIKQLKPDNISDIIAVISLYRPGPLENIPVYIRRKFGFEDVQYLHHKMENILSETFGIMIYQEQVMEVARVIAGYTLANADILRRAMGKKDPLEMDSQKSIFIQGAMQYSNIAKDLAGSIFDQMAKFAGYGFNKSHATAYAIISWQTAYLKAYYPSAFLASAMTAASHNNNRSMHIFMEFVEEAKNFHISVLLPNINNAGTKFTISNIDGINCIHYSLGAIKGVGEVFAQHLKSLIELDGLFLSLEDFLTRVDKKILNKRQLEMLIKSGALDQFDSNRSTLLNNIENLLVFNEIATSSKNSDQMALFGDSQTSLDSLNKLVLKEHPRWDYKIQIDYELDALGCFISLNPLIQHKDFIEQHNILGYRQFVQEQANENNYDTTLVIGYLIDIKIKQSKNGHKFANLLFHDHESFFYLTMFGSLYNRYFDLLKKKEIYICQISKRLEEGETQTSLETIAVFDSKKQYKVKMKKKKQPAVAIIADPLVEHITISDFQDIHTVKSQIISSIKGQDTLVIKIKNKNKYLSFEITDITLNIEALRQWRGILSS